MSGNAAVKPLIIKFNSDPDIAGRLMEILPAEQAEYKFRHFPDGETYLRIETPCADREVVLVSSLEHPDSKLLPLIFLSETARELGAASVGLVSPYLAYMRQDRRFEEGEAVTSRYFSKLISGYFDWLVTVDPHLHRYHELSEIYSIPNHIVHAAPIISAWIKENIDNPFLIGPDVESRQWVSEVAKDADAPYTVLSKIRTSDTSVEVSVPEISNWNDRTPVLVDDIISSGQTMIETLRHLSGVHGIKKPVCIGVHGIFADGAYKHILDSGASRVVTCNTIKHPSNGIDVSEYIAEGTLKMSHESKQPEREK